MNGLKKLNLGCGRDTRKGYVNLDLRKNPGVDIAHDLDKYPYPFKNSTFDEVYCKHVFGCIENIPKTLEELHRICKNGATIKILEAYYNSKGAYNDLTYKHYFNGESFDLIIKESAISHYLKKSFKIIKKELIPTKFGKIFPKGIREKASLVLGEVIASIYLEIRVIK